MGGKNGGLAINLRTPTCIREEVIRPNNSMGLYSCAVLKKDGQKKLYAMRAVRNIDIHSSNNFANVSSITLALCT